MARSIIIGILIAIVPAAASADHCRQFFVQKQVAYAAPVYAYAQPVIYQAGVNIENDALAAKVAQIVVGQLRAELQAGSLRQQQQAPPVTPSVFSSCVRCHAGAKPAGGVTLDGQTAINCDVYWRWGEMAGLGVNIPPEMEKLIANMTPEQKGAINAGLLKLPRLDAPQITQQPADLPPPAPVPQGQLQ